jgi:hypothetical protein
MPGIDMSENHNPEEPMIIKTDRPHTVSMPEGTNIAVGKKGEAGSPAVRKVLSDGEQNVAENVVMDGGVSKSNDPNQVVMVKEEVNKGFQSKEGGHENIKGYQSAADAPDRFTSQPKDAPVPPANKKSIDVSQLDSILKPQASTAAVDTITNESKKAAENPTLKTASTSSPMPEMNFPARVTKVKIENDQVRERLEKLE